MGPTEKEAIRKMWHPGRLFLFSLWQQIAVPNGLRRRQDVTHTPGVQERWQRRRRVMPIHLQNDSGWIYLSLVKFIKTNIMNTMFISAGWKICIPVRWCEALSALCNHACCRALSHKGSPCPYVRCFRRLSGMLPYPLIYTRYRERTSEMLYL